MIRPRFLLAAAAALLAMGVQRPPALPFIEDDYDAALTKAKAADRPIFVEMWAPW